MSNIMSEIIKSSLYITICISLIFILKDKVLNKYSATFKYILCIGIVIRGIFIFKINIAMPKFLDRLVNIKDNILNFDNTALQSNLHIDILELAFFIWIIGVVVKFIHYGNYNFKLYKRIKSLKIEVIDSDMHNILENHVNNLKIKKQIKIYKLNGIYSPMIVGVINPIIIIPNKDYSKNNLNYIFRHELIHYKRKDNILKVFLILFNTIHWFNPLAYIFAKYFHDQCELSCDELVIKRLSLNEIKEYSMLLLDMMKYKNKLESSMCVSYLSYNKSNIIKNRIEGVLSHDKLKKGSLFIIVLFIMSFVSVISIDNNVYVYEKIIEKHNDGSMVVDFTDPLDQEYVRKMVNKYGHYEVTIGKSKYSFSKSSGIK
ncbi:M56 family metallopeptidase [Clostridium sp. CCUG 7971]|uniref:M56 family metallopeptidase n=1 Tax=Clostridium sp. CCUG 7971 TaxID=2811414 RepID=UPI001ABA1D86|nr:M56 family metallopeptidase [Clostridium sp. CCUG 7971]MBO3444314.1 M56 family metallopeptidase [Clostridium sp. CCUG 7971]